MNFWHEKTTRYKVITASFIVSIIYTAFFINYLYLKYCFGKFTLGTGFIDGPPDECASLIKYLIDFGRNVPTLLLLSLALPFYLTLSLAFLTSILIKVFNFKGTTSSEILLRIYGTISAGTSLIYLLLLPFILFIYPGFVFHIPLGFMLSTPAVLFILGLILLMKFRHNTEVVLPSIFVNLISLGIIFFISIITVPF